MKHGLAVTKEGAISIFTEDKIDYVIHAIEKEVLSFVPDLSTAESRKEIASLARKVASAKVVIDGAGKELVSGWKAKSKLVDASRKEARDFLNDLRDRVRKPLTDWEKDEEEKKKKAILELEISESFDEAVLFNYIFDREKEVERNQLKIIEQQKEYERKVAYDLAEKEREEREIIIKEEAIEEGRLKEKREAEKAIEEARIKELKAKQKQENLRLQAIAIAEQAEQDRKDAEIKMAEGIALAKKEKIEAEERRVAEIKEAEEKRLADIKAAEEAVIAAEKRKNELAAIEKRKLEVEAERKAANKEHRREVNNEVLTDLMIECNLDELVAKAIIELIIKGKVRNISINY